MSANLEQPGKVANILYEPMGLVAAPLDCVPVDKPLPCPIYVRIRPENKDIYILFRNRDEILPAGRIEMLKEKHLDTVYIPQRYWKDFIGEIDTIRGLLKTNSRDKVTELGVGRYFFLVYGKDIEERRKLDRGTFKRFSILAEWLAQTMRSVREIEPGMLKRYRDPSLYFANHSFNVAICSAMVAYKVGFLMDSVKKLTLGALLHNIGNLAVPREVLYKPGAFSDDEWQMIRNHPRKGAEILMKLGAPREVVLTTAQHHERLDGRGYPDFITGHEMHIFAKICAAVDVYDAIKSPRPHEGPVDPEQAMKLIAKLEPQFEGQILNIVSSLES